MTNLFDALEFCLREIEEGVDLETTLRRFPEYAEELRPILETSIKARAMTAPEPSPEVVRRSRARVMQRAAELREAKAPVYLSRPRYGISLFHRLAIALGAVMIFLLSGSGLLSASASALPGERLYSVKRGWENVRLLFIFDTEARELLENEFENERLHEVNELLSQGRNEVIDFAGVFMQVNGISYVSGLQVILPAGMPVPANGTAVLVSGQTNAQGFIELLTLQVLPEGSSVPMGNPIAIEPETESAQDEADETQTDSGSTNEPKEVEVIGILNVISSNMLVINGLTAYLENAQIDGELCIGQTVEVKGYYAADGRYIVREVKGKGKCPGSGGGSSGSNNNSNSNSNANSNSNSNTNTNSNSNTNDDSNNSNDDNSSNDDDSNDDNSGSGGGGSDNNDD